MSENKMDRRIALLFFKDHGFWETVITGFLAALIISPFTFYFLGYPPEEFGTVICMHVILAIVSSCSLLPLSWARLFVFENSITLQRRYGHFVIKDAMEAKIEEAHLFFMEPSPSS